MDLPVGEAKRGGRCPALAQENHRAPLLLAAARTPYMTVTSPVTLKASASWARCPITATGLPPSNG
jgi:hypothetical protein